MRWQTSRDAGDKPQKGGDHGDATKAEMLSAPERNDIYTAYDICRIFIGLTEGSGQSGRTVQDLRLGRKWAKSPP